MYPLDYQKCKIGIKIVENLQDFFDLNPTDLKMNEPAYANQYIIKMPRYVKDITSSKILMIEIQLERQRIYTILTIVLPAILINVASVHFIVL